MFSYPFFQQFLWALLIQSPILVVSVAGVVITIGRWDDAPSAAIWSLLGFGLSTFICIGMPAGQAAIQLYMVSNRADPRSITQVFSVVGILWSILRTVSYGSLIAAVFSGRPKKQSNELR